MEQFKKNAVFYVILVLDFYGLPWLIRDTGSAMAMMLAVMPVVCVAASAGYGLRNGFRFGYVLAVAALFAPTIWIFYDESAWVYTVVYAGLAAVSSLIAGWLSPQRAR